jgi:hypothetical protein
MARGDQSIIPLGFVWRYALGWRSMRLEPEPLQLDPIAFGELVHELFSGAITRLEPSLRKS